MKPFRERNPILVGVISVSVLAVAMLFAFSLNKFTFFRGVRVVSADFADAAGLSPDNEVRVAGLKVGKVSSVELIDPDDKGVVDRVRVEMEVDGGLELGSGTEAEIKLKTILGAKFVDVVPKGGAPFIESEDVIPLSRTRIPFELYEVTNRSVETIGDLDAKALNDGLRELGDLFDDPDGNLGRALDGLSKSTKGLKDADGELQDLLRSGSQIVETLGSRSEALGRIFDSGAELLSALSTRRDSLNHFVSGTNSLAAELADLLHDNRANLDPALRDLHTVLVTVKKDLIPVEKAVQALGPSGKSFGRAFLQGRWGDIWLQTIFDLPVPPVLPLGFGASLPARAPAQQVDALAAMFTGGAT